MTTLLTSSLVPPTASTLELAEAFAHPWRTPFIVIRIPTVRSLQEIDLHGLH
jgi:hypothetical protein